MRIIVKFYFKNTFLKMKSNFKNNSFRNNFSYLKNIFNEMKKLSNTLNYCIIYFHANKSTFGTPDVKPKRAVN